MIAAHYESNKMGDQGMSFLYIYSQLDYIFLSQ